MGDGGDSDDRPYWTQGPWLWVIGGTLILLIIGLISFATPNGGEPDQTYVPPTIVDGEIVPGHFE